MLKNMYTVCMENMLTEEEVELIRAETPGTAHRLHFDNAGAALMAQPTLKILNDYVAREGLIGGYEARTEYNACLENVYNSVARLLNAAPDEIALTESGTVAWQRAFYAQSFAFGDRILTTTTEYGANYLAFLQTARRTGAIVDIIPDDDNGALDPAALEQMIDHRVKLIAINWIPTNGGLVNPAAEVGRIANERNIPFLLDGCQAVGQMPIDVEAIGCDMLAATGRKFLRGPRGTGFLYMRRSLVSRTEPAMIDMRGATWTGKGSYELRSDARRFETWEANHAARSGLGTAIDYALNIGLDRIEHRCRMLSSRLRGQLAEIPTVKIWDLGLSPSSTVSFSTKHLGANEVVARMAAKNINVSISPPSNTPIDGARRTLAPLVRASPHYYNTVEEVDRFVDAVLHLV